MDRLFYTRHDRDVINSTAVALHNGIVVAAIITLAYASRVCSEVNM
jgi:hypothetical protein